jgi:adenylate cyclase
MFIPLRRKILFFSLLLALLPLGLSGVSMITLTQDEIKSAINDNLINTSENLAKELDYLVSHAWRPPLELLASAINDDALDVREKVALLESTIKTLEVFWALQLYVEGFPPAQFVKPALVDKLSNPEDISQLFETLPRQTMQDLKFGEVIKIRDSHVRALPIWLPLQPINQRPAYLLAYANLEQAKALLNHHPFSRNGRIFLLNASGEVMFATHENVLPEERLRQTTARLIKEGLTTVGVTPFLDSFEQRRLGSYAVLNYLPWAVLATVSEAQIYSAATRMRWQLLAWAIAGLSAAVLVAFWFAARISAPVREVAHVAQQVGEGNLTARVSALRSNDEISVLGEQMNNMIQSLLQHFHLQKFVSGGTLQAVQQAGNDGVKLGGERRTATVFFSDIRGFTAFSEKVPPETVIQMLNTYLRAQAKLVKQHHGDIDKFVGDELVAVFQGEDMVANAVRCACAIHHQMAELNHQAETDWNIACGIGINSGDMVMGAMGSEERMDYTILGDTVNLGARLCSHATPGKTLISAYALEYLAARDEFDIQTLEPLQVKGKRLAVSVFNISGKET